MENPIYPAHSVGELRELNPNYLAPKFFVGMLGIEPSLSRTFSRRTGSRTQTTCSQSTRTTAILFSESAGRTTTGIRHPEIFNTEHVLYPPFILSDQRVSFRSIFTLSQLLTHCPRMSLRPLNKTPPCFHGVVSLSFVFLE